MPKGIIGERFAIDRTERILNLQFVFDFRFAFAVAFFFLGLSENINGYRRLLSAMIVIGL